MSSSQQHDPTRLLKVPTTPRKGTTTPHASTWKKVKTTVSSMATDPGSSTNKNAEKIIEFGDNGELFISYNNSIEVWDWIPSPNDPIDNEKDYNLSGKMYLVASLYLDDQIVNFKPLKCYRDFNYYVLVTCLKKGKDYFFQLNSFGQNTDELPNMTQPLILPPCSFGGFPFTINNTENFFAIVTNEGCVNVFDKLTNTLKATYSTKIKNDQPLIDISGDWLAYVPSDTKEMVSNFKKLHKKKKQSESSYKKFNNFNNNIKTNKTLSESTNDDFELDVTPLKLPSAGPLLNRVIKQLSSTAIDSALKLGEIGTNKVKSYLGHSSVSDPILTNLHIKETILKFINSSNNSIKKNNLANCQFIIVVDLTTLTPITIFSPPGGISKISLSPYDTHFATVNERGDNVYVWDLARIPKEISLIAKHSRGRTPGIIKQILWYKGDMAIGIVTKANGSIHWFENFGDDVGANLNSINYWTLTSLKSSQICLGPNLSLHKLKSKEFYKGESKCILSIDFNSETLLIINPYDGQINWKYNLPDSSIPKSLLPTYMFPSETKYIESELSRLKLHSSLLSHPNDPLSKIEVKTTNSLSSPSFRNRRFQFGNYNFNPNGYRKIKGSFTKNDELDNITEALDNLGPYMSHSSSNNSYIDFRDNYEVFGQGFTVDFYQFGRNTGLPVFLDKNDETSLLFSSDSEKEEEEDSDLVTNSSQSDPVSEEESTSSRESLKLNNIHNQ